MISSVGSILHLHRLKENVLVISVTVELPVGAQQHSAAEVKLLANKIGGLGGIAADIQLCADAYNIGLGGSGS